MRRLISNLIVASISMCVAHAAPDAELESDIETSLKKLGEVRAQISQEKPVLGKKVADLEQQLVLLRRQQRLARMSAEGRENDMKSLRKDHAVYTQDAKYLEGQLKQYAATMSTQLLPGEDAQYNALLESSLSNKDSRTLDEQVEIISVGMDRLEAMFGGTRTKGDAVDERGEVVSGSFVHLGPASWFASTDGAVAGPVLTEAGSQVVKVLDGNKEAVTAVLNGQEASIAIDVTGGKARAIDEIQSSGFGDLLKKGGVWLIPILGIALLSAVCGLIKLNQLRKIKTPRDGWVAEILAALRDGKQEEAEQIAGSVQHPAGNLLKKAIGYTSAGTDVVEEVIYEQLIGVQGKLQSWLPFIAVTAATAPLLGLLGTVSGMIRMFNVITVTGTGDVKPMAGGISEALVTTLFGLIVAIPALIIHTLLSRRSNGVVQNTEKLGLTLVNGLRKLQ